MSRDLLQRWPQISTLIKEEGLLYIDLFLADMLACHTHLPEQCFIALLCKLSSASRCGHLCLRIDEKGIFPSSLEYMEDEEVARQLDALALAGLKYLSPFLQKEAKALFFDGERLYFQKSAYFEENVARQIERLLSKKSVIQPAHIVYNQQLTEQQRKAVYSALASPLSLITGGPGTGKTRTAASIISAYLESCEDRDKVIFLAAPTGRAAAHLEKNVKKNIVKESCTIVSGTLHSLLSIRKESDLTSISAPPLAVDFCIVDECSMIDAKLFSHFLSRIGSDTTLVLIGDKDQLPPVESGSFFADLIDMSQRGIGPHASTLSECFRSDKRDILRFAQAINTSDTATLSEMMQDDLDHIKKVSFCSEGLSPKESLERLWCFCLPHFPITEGSAKDPLHLLDAYENFRILSALRKGSLGTEAINDYFLEKSLALPTETSYLSLPIMITKNDHAMQLFNGDMGVVIRAAERKGAELAPEDTVYFYDKAGTGVRSISAIMLPEFCYCFALSVHKSQGSEYGSVVILAPKGSERLGKEMLYTAVTRAKQKVYLDIPTSTLEQIAMRSSRKISGLHVRLKEK